MTSPFILAKTDKAPELRALFAKGLGLKAADEEGRTLLHHAAAGNAIRVMDLLLERGASLYAKDAHGYTVRTHLLPVEPFHRFFRTYPLLSPILAFVVILLTMWATPMVELLLRYLIIDMRRKKSFVQGQRE